MQNCFQKAFFEWTLFKAQNDSPITDNFFGLLENSLSCPVCEKSFRSFSPFLSISLPIPVAPNLSNLITFIPFQSDKPVVQFSIPILFEIPFALVKKRIEEIENRKMYLLFTIRKSSKIEILFDYSASGLESNLIVFEYPDPSKFYVFTQPVVRRKVFCIFDSFSNFDFPFLIQFNSSQIQETELNSTLQQGVLNHYLNKTISYDYFIEELYDGNRIRFQIKFFSFSTLKIILNKKKTFQLDNLGFKQILFKIIRKFLFKNALMNFKRSLFWTQIIYGNVRLVKEKLQHQRNRLFFLFPNVLYFI